MGEQNKETNHEDSNCGNLRNVKSWIWVESVEWRRKAEIHIGYLQNNIVETG